MSSQKTKPVELWTSGEQITAAKLNQTAQLARQGRINIMGKPGAGIRGGPNGSAIDLPDDFIPSNGVLGVIWSTGPSGEADFTNEQYWVWVSYVIADKWGLPVDMDRGYPASGTDLSNTIWPATNWSERQPGGPAGSGTHVLRVGTPVILYPVRGRTSDTSSNTIVQRFAFVCEDVGVGQYPGQVLVTEAAHTRQWSYITAVPSLT